jgi:hypothetical protein
LRRDTFALPGASGVTVPAPKAVRRRLSLISFDHGGVRSGVTLQYTRDRRLTDSSGSSRPIAAPNGP